MEPKSIDRIYWDAAQIASPSERQAYLDQACGDDGRLRQKVEQLLEMRSEAEDFLESPAPAPVMTVAEQPSGESPGTLIGPYKLMEQIGEGGMGLVFVAEQQHPVRRRVALKIIKPGMDSRQVIARFEAERQALALMDHQNIAKVYDAGTTESGRPYFVMELVHGVPISDYCDANRLTPRQRLELFVPVCHAVQHAHQKGIIHRDLKPSNVLVTMYDDRPVPKVIDFGVAKAVEQRLTEATVYTQFGTLVGTFEYMSPEQAEMNAFGVDTRSDIYSLGVLLYELLTGTTPLERPRLRQAAFDEIRRIIKEEEPERPSVRLSTSGALAKVAAARKTDPAKLSRLMRGELDWVVMRCLEKDRTRRYDTVSALARDVERYLRDEPVDACPPSTGYRLRKLARKYKKPIAAAAACTGLLLAALALVTWEWQAERTARSDADAARDDAEGKAREIAELAERMNEANAASDLAGQHAMLARWAAAEAAHGRAIELLRDHARVWLQRGELYSNMGLWDLALDDYQRSFGLRPPDIVLPWCKYALLKLLRGDQVGYESVCRRMRERFGDSKELLVQGTLTRACSLLPRPTPAHDWTLAPEDLLHVPSSVVWVGRYESGLAHLRAGRYPAAIRDLRESLALTAYHARALNFPVLAMALHRAGQADAARKELEVSRQELDRWVLAALHSSDDLIPWGYWHDWAEFLLNYNQAYRLIQGTAPPEDPRLRILRGRAFAALGRRNRAAAEYADAQRVAPNDPEIRKAIEVAKAPPKPAADRLGVLADSYARAEAWDQALATYNEAAALDPSNHVFLYVVAVLRLRAGDVRGYRQACATMLERFGDTEQPDMAERIAKTCLLMPDAVHDLSRVRKLADRAVTGTEEHPWYHYFVFVKALAEYRAGRPTEAVKWVERLGPTAVGGNMDAYAFTVLALAQHRLGHADAAHAALERAEQIVAKKMPDPAAGRPFGGDWHDWLRCQALLREAEHLLKEPAAANRNQGNAGN